LKKGWRDKHRGECDAYQHLWFGLCGAVCAGCLSARGHEVIGVDVSSTKIDLINQGKSPIVEPGLEALLQQGVANGRCVAPPTSPKPFVPATCR
jgi:UDP-glucose 6-dehydrogenase